MRAASLRARVMLGALLWTIGLFLLSGVALILTMRAHPGAPADVHGLFDGYVAPLIAAVCLFGGFLEVRSGLSGMDAIRSRLSELHAGRERRLAGSYPAEVQPLVNDLNVLLDQRDRAVERALAKAGDLAHGLKTPLAVLAHDAERATDAGQPDLAASIHQQVERMRRQVDYHIAHARAASGRTSGDRCDLRESVDGLVRALNRLHADRRIAIEVGVTPGCTVQAQRADVDEMLGNLLDNACRFARRRVAIVASPEGQRLSITVDDDGPGLAPALWDAVLQRGVRADESGPGSGLGLAIVRDLAELYGGSIALGPSPLGGLRATLTLDSGLDVPPRAHHISISSAAGPTRHNA